jgi:hypothetical protein
MLIVLKSIKGMVSKKTRQGQKDSKEKWSTQTFDRQLFGQIKASNIEHTIFIIRSTSYRMLLHKFNFKLQQKNDILMFSRNASFLVRQIEPLKQQNPKNLSSNT